ncbi:hypothetical protein L596_019291 [Steinernema carpocapsae]|uniref:Globin family profile domain-containing protein n=1 Tax=Steinernema carpocapsae TaxID=34508 RepID=A0A4U5MQL7_STECR|nr:hypothetical protein L596_019291 [Steinernema carpocapsae]
MGCSQTKSTPKPNRKIPKIELSDISKIEMDPPPSHQTNRPPPRSGGSWCSLSAPKKTPTRGSSLRLTAPGRKRSFSCRSMLSPDDKEILQKHWIPTVLTKEPDIFIRIMLDSIRDCPKLLDVIACNMRPCSGINEKTLYEWPKLRKLSKGNCAFFTRQIVINKLDESIMKREAEMLGPIHIQYAPFGFEPFFLDIWQVHAIKRVDKINFPSDVDKILFVKAFTQLCSFLCSLMAAEYDDSMQSMLYLEETIKDLNC